MACSRGARPFGGSMRTPARSERRSPFATERPRMNDEPRQTMFGRPGFAVSGDAGLQKIAASFARRLVEPRAIPGAEGCQLREAQQVGDVRQPQLPVREMLRHL